MSRSLGWKGIKDSLEELMDEATSLAGNIEMDLEETQVTGREAFRARSIMRFVEQAYDRLEVAMNEAKKELK